MERVAPRQVLYEQQLPLAIESTSQRRIFFPEGGSKYGPSGNGANPNIIRIPINADDMLDPTESYLQFKFTNKSGNTMVPDIGLPFVRRLRIESSGTTLEDISEYGTLYANLVASQVSQGGYTEATITTAGVTSTNGTGAIAGAGLTATTLPNGVAIGGADDPPTRAQLVTALNNTAGAGGTNNLGVRLDALDTAVRNKINALTTNVTLGGNHPPFTTIANDGSVFYNVPLVSALLNSKKYLPLVFMNGGITLELELDIVESAGSFQGAVGNGFEIENVRYMAHMVSLQRDFYDKLRMVMEGSGGVLQLAGTTYRHFQNTFGDVTSVSVPLPAKVKSMKGLLFVQKNSANIGNKDRFYISNSLNNGTNEYQLRVGSMVYPPTSIKIDNTAANVITNKGEAYQELRKLFGTLGDYTHGGVFLNNTTYAVASDTGNAAAGGGGAVASVLNPMGLSLESFKGNLESGINSADKNLSMSLELRRANGPANSTRIDMYAMCDAIFYVNLDGSVTSSV